MNADPLVRFAAVRGFTKFSKAVQFRREFTLYQAEKVMIINPLVRFAVSWDF